MRYTNNSVRDEALHRALPVMYGAGTVLRFSGILTEASVLAQVFGNIYCSKNPKFGDGDFIHTSQVVAIEEFDGIPVCITASGGAYIIASQETSSPDLLAEKRQHLAVNADHFAGLARTARILMRERLPACPLLELSAASA